MGNYQVALPDELERPDTTGSDVLEAIMVSCPRRYFFGGKEYEVGMTLGPDGATWWLDFEHGGMVNSQVISAGAVARIIDQPNLSMSDTRLMRVAADEDGAVLTAADDIDTCLAEWLVASFVKSYGPMGRLAELADACGPGSIFGQKTENGAS